MDIPMDLGRRIVEASRLAVLLHLQTSMQSVATDGAQIGGADLKTGDAWTNQNRSQLLAAIAVQAIADREAA